jgi:predicted ester cyclase
MTIPPLSPSCAASLTPARRATLESFYGALATKELDLVDKALTTDWEDIPLAPGQGPGPAGIKPIFAMLLAAFPDLTLDIVDALSEGNRVAIRVQCASTHDGDLFGVPASGKLVRFNLHEFHEFEGDRVKRTWHLEDLFGLFAQIGSWPALAPEAV